MGELSTQELMKQRKDVSSQEVLVQSGCLSRLNVSLLYQFTYIDIEICLNIIQSYEVKLFHIQILVLNLFILDTNPSQLWWGWGESLHWSHCPPFLNKSCKVESHARTWRCTVREKNLLFFPFSMTLLTSNYPS